MTPTDEHPDGLRAERVEISNGVQDGPARVTGQLGTSLDYSHAGVMMFIVAVVYDDGSRENLSDYVSYEAAIIEAEEAAADWRVPVVDLVEP